MTANFHAAAAFVNAIKAPNKRGGSGKAAGAIPNLRFYAVLGNKSLRNELRIHWRRKSQVEFTK